MRKSFDLFTATRRELDKQTSNPQIPKAQIKRRKTFSADGRNREERKQEFLAKTESRPDTQTT